MSGKWAVVVSYADSDDIWTYFDTREIALRDARIRVADGHVNQIEVFAGKARRVAIVYVGTRKISGTTEWSRTGDTWVCDDVLPLRAFGEAIAMVARGRLISRVADGGTFEMRSRSGALISVYSHSRGCKIFRYSEYWNDWNGSKDVVASWNGNREDLAADVVERLIEIEEAS